ncbi:tyrosine- phosphatase Lar isoform X1 [Brachionus plicatilis]|uniref:Tyrosine-phosphatase Lar isoform X1 n=1 Tax=Brachionus plicatilis TaxID=10195 RepID=A0A3M7SLG9_BRAPC|nr:tyrosine- phosphatase Lar isoform X1 [Brachionus plicatilis]
MRNIEIFLIIWSLVTFNLVPGEPQDFKVVKVTSRTIELEWKAPRREEQSSGNNIKGYEIHYYKVNAAGTGPDALFTDPKDTQVFKRKTNNVKKLKYTLTDLEPNSQYQVQIFAYNMKGDGQRSSPLQITTLDEGPGKPENIRSEIYNDQLNIKWQAPSVKPNLVGAYVIHFNNEKYQVDGQTNQISIPSSQWEYDRQYEFRIYAKTNSDSVPNGAEAVFRISTQIMCVYLLIQRELRSLSKIDFDNFKKTLRQYLVGLSESNFQSIRNEALLECVPLLLASSAVCGAHHDHHWPSSHT